MKLPTLNQKAIFDFLESKKALVACVVVAGFLALIFSGHNKMGKEELKADASVDTYIPAGFVLVPIEVQNYESLDSILGSHGIVDLYSPSQKDTGKGVRVAQRVRIMRAPLNPSQFAVLVRENDSDELVRSDSGFFVVVQNSKQTGTGFVNSELPRANKRVSRVVMEAE